MRVQRILCIGGFWSKQNPIWNTIEMACGSEFPGAEFVVEEEEMLHPYQVRRIRAAADRIVRNYDDGKRTLLLLHSFGGKVGLNIAPRFDASEILGMATICSPHALPFEYALASAKPVAPLVTFGGIYDYVVPHWFARHPQAVAHVLMPIDHWRDVASNLMHAQQIVIETNYFLFKRNSKT